MTIIDNTRTETTPIAADEQSAGLVWERVEGVEPAIWTGRVRGIFVGMVEARWQEGFTATSRLGRKLGSYGTLEDAELAFVITPAQRRNR